MIYILKIEISILDKIVQLCEPWIHTLCNRHLFSTYCISGRQWNPFYYPELKTHVLMGEFLQTDMTKMILETLSYKFPIL